MLDSKSLISFSKEVWIGWISSSVEAYNMAIYSFLAPLLAPLLFQYTNPSSAIFFSYSLVFLGFCFLYPLGALYYGWIGDRYGRQKICIYSTFGLAVATGLMGLLPMDLLKGGWIYFLILIGAQYFFSGGEYHGSIIFSLEHSEKQHSEKQHSDPQHADQKDQKIANGLMSALSCLFAVFGLLLANGLATISFIMQDEFWMRFCFLLGAGGGLLSYYLKTSCAETPAFSVLNKELLKEAGWSIFISENWLKIISVVFVFAFFMVSYSYIFIFLPLMDLDANIQEFSTFKSLICYGFFLVLSGLLADKIGLTKAMMIGFSLFSIVILPVTYFFKDLIVLQMVLTPCACLVIGPIHSWMLQQFKVQERCRGIFASSAIAMFIFGGSTPPLCLMIFEASQSLVICSLFPFAIGTVALTFLICSEKISLGSIHKDRQVYI